MIIHKFARILISCLLFRNAYLAMAVNPCTRGQKESSSSSSDVGENKTQLESSKKRRQVRGAAAAAEAQHLHIYPHDLARACAPLLFPLAVRPLLLCLSFSPFLSPEPLRRTEKCN